MAPSSYIHTPNTLSFTYSHAHTSKRIHDKYTYIDNRTYVWVGTLPMKILPALRKTRSEKASLAEIVFACG